MTRLEKKLRGVLRRMAIGADQMMVVAVSGGADSVALLDALVCLRDCKETPKKLVVAHLNHLLRGDESDADETFVRDLATRLDLPVCSERLNVAQIAQYETRNLEAAARQVRYEFLQRVAKQFGAQVIATAHTRDDQVETLWMRLLRGTGAEGLRGIQAVTAFSSSLRLIRPLLDSTRADVIAHCAARGILYRTDSSNAVMDFTRNRVRHELLPLLRSFNPRVDESLLRLVERLTEDDDVLQGVAERVYASARLPASATLAWQPLYDAHPAIRGRVLRLWLREIRGDLRRIDAVHLRALEQLILHGEGGSYIELPGGWQVWRRKGMLVMINQMNPRPGRNET